VPRGYELLYRSPPSAVGKLRSDGYRIALDDLVFRPELGPLLELADVVKVDALALGPDGLREQVRLLAPVPLEAAPALERAPGEELSALLEREGWLGNLFGRVTDDERGDFVHATRAPLDPATLTRAYLAAIESSTALMSQAPV
jgi:hypothetical protein